MTSGAIHICMSTALTKYAVGWYSVPAGVGNALERFKPRAPYEADGDVMKKSVKEVMRIIKRICY